MSDCERDDGTRIKDLGQATCDLALVVGAARSGTTLTRVLLDAHPEIGCPSEAGLPALMSQLARVWLTVHADQDTFSAPGDPGRAVKDGEAPARWDEPPHDDDGGQPLQRSDAGSDRTLPADARAWIVSAVQGPMIGYCAKGAKRMYCDKSLDSVFHLGLVHELFPEARMVLVYRHVMDTVASGLEASPWGFNAYGYGPYVQSSPGNTVAALASYWLDHVERALSWEQEQPEVCHRVRYEDLVMHPEKTVIGIQRFLGVREDLSVLARAFERASLRGPGDYKIEHTTGVHADSIGHGKRVPITVLPPALLKALNERLERLGYEAVDSGWNTAERLIDGGSRGLWAAQLVDMMARVRVGSGNGDAGSFAVVAEDHRSLRWVIDPDARTVYQGDGEVDAVLTGTAEDLVLMLTGDENLGVLVRSGRVRHLVADEGEAARRDVMRELTGLVALLRGQPCNNRARPPG